MMLIKENDLKFMRKALNEAQIAFNSGEIPIGAIVVRDGKVVAGAHNMTRSLNDPTAHAEVLVIRKAARRLRNERLLGTILYTTIEPCIMCAGAIVQARIDTVVYGAKDPKAGALGSVYKVHGSKKLNHHFKVISGVLSSECSKIIRDFFKSKRR